MEYRKRLHDFLEQNLVPNIDKWEMEGQIPKSLWESLGAKGFLCPCVSKEYGGLGGDFLYSVIIAEEIAKTNQWGLTMNHHCDIAASYIQEYCSDFVKETYLSKCVKGEIVLGMGLTEPDAGSDIFGIRTTAIEKEDTIILNGTKTFISNAICADLFVIAAKDITPERTSDFALFIVPSDAKGFKRGRKIDKLGWRSQDTGELILDDCRIPSNYRVGNASDGLKIFFDNIQIERLIIAITAIMESEQVLKTTVNTHTEPFAQKDSFNIVDLLTEIKIGRCYIENLIERHMQDEDIMLDINMSKVWITELANKVTNICLLLNEHESVVGESFLARAMCDTRVIKITGAANETLKDAVANTLNLDKPDKKEFIKFFESWNDSVENIHYREAYWRKLSQDKKMWLRLFPDQTFSKKVSINKCKEYIKGELLYKLTCIASQYNISIENVLLTLWYSLLFKYTEQKDVVVGYVTQDSVLPLELYKEITSDVLFDELLLMTPKTISRALKNEISINKIIEIFNENNASCPNVLFNYNKKIVSENCFFDLYLDIQKVDGDMEITMLYNSQNINGNNVERLLGHYFNMINQITEKCDSPLKILQLVTRSERSQILNVFNRPVVDCSMNPLLHEMFEKHALESPQNIALQDGEKEYSYKEINEKANQIAHYIMELGVEPGDKIGVFMSKSVRMITTILAVWKVGATYVPLVPSLPKERCSYIISVSDIKYILTCSYYKEQLPLTNSKIVFLDLRNNDILLYAKDNLNIKVTNTDLAYIIFTSGTTGLPNGVALKHKGLSNLAVSQSNEFSVQENSVVLQLATVIFDASVSEIAMAICAGARLVVLEEKELFPGEPLSTAINTYQVTHMTITPSALAVQPIEEFPSLSNLILASESSTPEIIRTWERTGRVIYNAYGPSECTVCATIKKFGINDVLSIGKPIRNVRVYILDQDMNLLPVGVKGEIYIGGVGVGQGYIKNDTLNNKKFIDNPLDKTEKLFKTQDIGYWLPDGNIQFVGRCDDQVKIRGYRVELKEIEAVLTSHKGIAISAVTIREDMGKEKQLVAYVVKSELISISKEDIISYLESMLPNYMIPAHIVFMEKMPKNSSDKINYKELPKPEFNSTLESENKFDNIEEILLNKASDIIGLDISDINYTLKQIGFTSLSLVRLLTDIKSRYAVTLPIAKIKYSISIKEIAELVKVAIKYKETEV